MTAEPTFADACDAIVTSLRDCGWQDVTASMVVDVYCALVTGQPLPHGLVGRFAAGAIDAYREMFDILFVEG